jgi:TonB-linked SusC/RagA family outer membrane protein
MNKNFLAITMVAYLRTIIFGTISLANVSAKIEAQNLNQTYISLDKQELTLGSSIHLIEAQTDFHFSYSNDISLEQQIVIKSSGKIDMKSMLECITQQCNVEFLVIGQTIAINNLKNTRKQEKDKIITGKVVDENGEPMVGVTIAVEGTTEGTTTDLNGKFEIRVPSQNNVLTISFIGYKTIYYNVNQGTNPTIHLNLQSQQVNEVVVTALGITKEQRKLGYAEHTITNENIDQAPTSSLSEVLAGKIAGVNIINSSSGPINSQEIKLRGDNSLNLNGNNALIVIDGTPVNNEFVVSGSGSGDPGDSENNPAYMGNDVHVDFGNSLANINPQDIKSITVLKGPGATALYGSRASNGALIITTKSGSTKKGLGISISSGIDFDIVQREPDWQYEYGQGLDYTNTEGDLYYSYGISADGSNTSSTSSAFGPKFNGQYYYQYDPEIEGQSLERQLWQPYKNNRSDFWETGVTSTNSISIYGGGKNGSGRLSLTSVNNKWIMPNTGNKRFTISTKNSYQVHDKIRLNASLMYTSNSSDNIPGTGYNNHSISYFMIFQNPNVNLDWYKPIWTKDGYKTEQIAPFSSYIMNPYLIAHEIINSYEGSAITGSISTKINLTSKLNLFFRSGINTNQQDRQQCIPYDVSRYAEGYFKTQDIYIEEINSDFLLNYNSVLPDNWSLDVSAGGNIMTSKYRRMDASVEGLVIPDLYKLSNGQNSASVRTYDKNKQVNSLYAMATIGFKDILYLDFTGRNDWSSTLPAINMSYFYPSLNASFIVSELVKNTSIIDFLKYRISIAQVGNDAAPYYTSKYYNTSDFASSSTLPSTIYNPGFKPEQTLSYETGCDFRLLKSRLGGDITAYYMTTKNQILTVPILHETGYSNALVNSGEVENKGIELLLFGKPIKHNSFEWKLSGTWSKNLNKVLSLPDGLEGEKQIAEGGRAYFIAKVGGTTSAIYGYGFVRSPDGQIVYEKETGLAAYPEEIEYQGDALPDWKAGITNQFKIKNFKISVVFDGQYGGIIYSQTHHKAAEMGKLKHTLAGREEGFIIGEGVVLNEDGTYSPNTVKANVVEFYRRQYRRYNVESNSFDASFIKLRELSIEYNLPKKISEKAKMENVSLSLYGRNLYTWTEFPIYDPEAGARLGSSILPGIEMGQLPSPATYGFRIKLQL